MKMNIRKYNSVLNILHHKKSVTQYVLFFLAKFYTQLSFNLSNVAFVDKWLSHY